MTELSHLERSWNTIPNYITARGRLSCNSPTFVLEQPTRGDGRGAGGSIYQVREGGWGSGEELTEGVSVETHKVKNRASHHEFIPP